MTLAYGSSLGHLIFLGVIINWDLQNSSGISEINCVIKRAQVPFEYII